MGATKMLPVEFRGISRDRFSVILQRIVAQAASVEIVGDYGTACGEGFEVRWSYDEADQELTMQCIRKPWWATKDGVLVKMRDLVEAE